MKNYAEIIRVGEKLYYEINPESRMDVPSYFYEKLETYWDAWYLTGNATTFYDYCKSRMNKNTES